MKLRSNNPSSLPLSREVKFIPYNKLLVSRAKELRNNPTESEKILWEKVLKQDKLLGLRFLRQKPLDNFIVDFYCAKLMVAIEVDGEVHLKQKERDVERDSLLFNKFGVWVIRLENKDVINHIEKITSRLISELSPLIKG